MNDLTENSILPRQEAADTEVAMIEAARKNLSAFGALYDQHVQSLYRYLYSRVGNRADAEDLTAQTFLAALEGFPRYRHKGYFSAWLFSIARTKSIDHFRRQNRITHLSAAQHIKINSDFLQDSIKNEHLEMLAALIQDLNDKERDLIQLRYVANLKFREIATILEIKEETVKKSLYRLLARLKIQMEGKNE